MVDQLRRELDGLREICMTTNGLALAAQAKALKAAGLDRVNVSLDTLDAERFQLITKYDGLAKVLRGVDAALEAGHRVEAIPGPSAVIAALATSGLAPHPFVFLGFLPRKSGPRKKRLEAYREREETLVIFESPHRVGALLRDAAESLGARRASVARELTKVHEEIARGPLPELALRFAAGCRGEVTVVIEGLRRARAETR